MTIDVGSAARPADLAAAAFAALAAEFFEEDGSPIRFELRDKRQTQDDPFDEHVAAVLSARLPESVKVFGSAGPLISPDVVLARQEETALLLRGGGEPDSRHVIGIEVKKLNSTGAGRAARATGMDYNSTPPCQTIKVETEAGRELRVPATYLFVELVLVESNEFYLRSLALVAGSALNEDVELYDRITGVRQKAIGLGTYGDGLDRQRPMLVFANPLGWDWLQDAATLIHPTGGLDDEQDLELRRTMVRTTTDGDKRTFGCYRLRESPGHPLPDAVAPFRTSRNRRTETTQRGRFRISLARER
ncbi:MAG: hypothetical protein PIR53_10690 [Nocardioides alkalitolerans]